MPPGSLGHADQRTRAKSPSMAGAYGSGFSSSSVSQESALRSGGLVRPTRIRSAAALTAISLLRSSPNRPVRRIMAPNGGDGAMNDKSRPAISGDSDGVVAGRYRLIRLLGEGERKRTYLAEDTIVGRQVALAMVKLDALHSDPRGTAREVAAICQTGNHDNGVTLYDRGTADGSDYLVFEYLSGGNLREHLAQRRRNHESITPEELRRLGRQLARALSHVHARGLLHRDVAPANIWLDERHVAHLGDFDSAMRIDDIQADVLPPTTEGYASPEQVSGKSTDERSDLYSLGAVLYEALTGEVPRRSVKGTVVAPRVLRPDTPADLNALICRLMAPRQEDRPPSAEELLEELKPPFAKRRPEGLFPWAEGLPFPL